jgi:pimeloyl-ACP methyl ester carboxylesterase
MSLPKQLMLQFVRTKFKLLSSISKRKAAERAFKLFCTPQVRTITALPLVFKGSEKIEFPFQGNIVRGYRWNHPSAKKALILHGFESSVVNFDKYIDALVKKGYEVLAFDAPAHGRSTGKTINAIVYREMVQHIWNSYGPIDSLITHSFGGLVLSLALEKIPHSSSTKIVFIAPAAETKTAIDNFFALLRLGAGVRKEFDAIITEQAGHPPEWYSVSRVAPLIRGQVLFLQDKDDQMTPLSDVEQIIEKKYPNFHFVISEGLGHRRIYRDDRSFKKIMEFLET